MLLQYKWFISFTSYCAVFDTFQLQNGDRDFQQLEEVVKAVQELTPPTVPDHILHPTLTLPQAQLLPESSSNTVEPETPPAPSRPNSRPISRTESMNSLSSTPAEPEDPNVSDVTGQLTCKVCLTKLVGIIFLPCGHLGKWCYSQTILARSKFCHTLIIVWYMS